MSLQKVKTPKRLKEFLIGVAAARHPAEKLEKPPPKITLALLLIFDMFILVIQ
jgi:hypothetical protein